MNHVRLRLIESISRDGGQDGMDAILLCIPMKESHTAKTIVHYAAANNAPFIIRKGEPMNPDADKMPVGKGERSESFALRTIELEQGDVIYLYTDGYADQFGGPNGKKFMYKRLNSLLHAIHQKPMNEQQAILEKTLKDWKGQTEQVDDICIIGMRL